MERRTRNLPSILRPFTAAERALPRALILTGPRGVGKTTYLLHHAQGRRLLYLSADNPMIASGSLYHIVNEVLMAGYEGVIVDEVHHCRDWSLHLKALYDDFPAHIIWVSDSSSLVLRTGTGDLSRRFLPITMPLLSFREFLSLETGTEFPIFQPWDHIPVDPNADILHYFQEYRRQGTRPFYSEIGFKERMLAILDKTLHSDVPFFLPRITDDNLRLMNAVIQTLAGSSIPRIQVRSLCNDWNIGAEKLYQLLYIMESVGVVRIVRKQNDHKANTAGDKLFLADPAYYSILAGERGSERESLFAAMLIEAGYSLYTSRLESEGDFILPSPLNGQPNSEPLKFEIGGRKKEKKQSDFMVRDNIDYATGGVLPLWSFGFLY